MKYLLFTLLILLPALSRAQDIEKTPKNEFGLSAGVSFFMPKSIDPTPRPLAALKYLRNLNQYQLGLTVETAVLNSNYVYFIPALMANRKFGQNKSYLYAGLALGGFIGYNKVFDMKQPGVMLGIQGGYVLSISNHFSFTTEIGARGIYTWTSNPYGRNLGQLIPHIPIAIGFRYKF